MWINREGASTVTTAIVHSFPWQQVTRERPCGQRSACGGGGGVHNLMTLFQQEVYKIPISIPATMTTIATMAMETNGNTGGLYV